MLALRALTTQPGEKLHHYLLSSVLGAVSIRGHVNSGRFATGGRERGDRFLVFLSFLGCTKISSTNPSHVRVRRKRRRSRGETMNQGDDQAESRREYESGIDLNKPQETAKTPGELESKGKKNITVSIWQHKETFKRKSLLSTREKKVGWRAAFPRKARKN